MPLVVREPFQLVLAGLLEPVHDVGLFVALQVMLALLPCVIVIGLIDRLTTGLEGVLTVKAMLLALPVPPAFWHVSEK